MLTVFYPFTLTVSRIRFKYRQINLIGFIHTRVLVWRDLLAIDQLIDTDHSLLSPKRVALDDLAGYDPVSNPFADFLAFAQNNQLFVDAPFFEDIYCNLTGIAVYQIQQIKIGILVHHLFNEPARLVKGRILLLKFMQLHIRAV